MKNLTIVVTGPTGSGKTSVSLALAKKLDKCVFIEVDHIKHMILSGFYKQNKQWLYSEWKLVGQTIGIMTNNFLANDFNVVIGGYMHSDGWTSLSNQVDITHKFLLNPSKEVIKIRDNERDSKYFMGEEAIQEHIEYLAINTVFEDFHGIDSTEQTVEQTVDEILDRIS